jgi:hypothetical protein
VLKAFVVSSLSDSTGYLVPEVLGSYGQLQIRDRYLCVLYDQAPQYAPFFLTDIRLRIEHTFGRRDIYG